MRPDVKIFIDNMRKIYPSACVTSHTLFVTRTVYHQKHIYRDNGFFDITTAGARYSRARLFTVDAEKDKITLHSKKGNVLGKRQR